VQEVDAVIQAARALDPRVESAYKWFELRTIASEHGVDDFAVSDTRMIVSPGLHRSARPNRSNVNG
jgi:hypothetical protein